MMMKDLRRIQNGGVLRFVDGGYFFVVVVAVAVVVVVVVILRRVNKAPLIEIGPGGRTGSGHRAGPALPGSGTSAPVDAGRDYGSTCN